MDGDKLYFVSGGRYEIPDDVDVKKARLDDYEFAFLDVFDLDGNLLKTVDLGSDLDIQFDNPHKERRSGLYFEVDDNSVKDGKIDLGSTGITDEMLASVSCIHIVACGSAWHVGMAAKYIFEDMAEIPVYAELASEFRYRKLLLDKDALVLVISQSGETADSLAALRIAKEKGVQTLAIVNVVGSTIAREADHVLHTIAGPEIAVATTKAYSAQLAAGYLLAIQFLRLYQGFYKLLQLVMALHCVPSHKPMQ